MAEQTQQQIIIHTQYIKDFSFENPNAPGSLARNDTAPEIEISVNVNAQPQQQQRVFEVVLTINAAAKRDDQHVFLAELAHGAVVSVSEDVEENIIHPLVMIEGPRLIFPFARQMISEMTQSGGYMPLNIQPIDFVRLYQSSMENQTAEAGAAGTAEGSKSNGADGATNSKGKA